MMALLLFIAGQRAFSMPGIDRIEKLSRIRFGVKAGTPALR